MSLATQGLAGARVCCDGVWRASLSGQPTAWTSGEWGGAAPSSAGAWWPHRLIEHGKAQHSGNHGWQLPSGSMVMLAMGGRRQGWGTPSAPRGGGSSGAARLPSSLARPPSPVVLPIAWGACRHAAPWQVAGPCGSYPAFTRLCAALVLRGTTVAHWCCSA